MNLAPEKQEKLLSAAVREFTERPYNEASINRIVREAGIPRGSFYMYFRDKEDLFHYLMEESINEMLMVFEEVLHSQGGDIFAALPAMYDHLRSRRSADRSLGGMGMMSAIVNRNDGLQKGGLLEFLDPDRILKRMKDCVNPDLLDLREPEDLNCILRMLIVLIVPIMYNGIRPEPDPEDRESCSTHWRSCGGAWGQRPTPHSVHKGVVYMKELMKETQAGQTVPTSETEPKKKIGFPKSKKAKKWMKIAAAAAVIAALAAGCMARASKKANAYLGGSYLVAQATRQDLTLSVTGTATLKPADSYNVTTLISGEIENAPFELGDLVNKGDLLFALNSSDAQNNVDRAEISVAQAKMAYQQAKEALNPVASISGTIQELYVHNGDSVNAGAQIAKITSSMDLSIDFLFPYASPTDFYAGQAATVYIGNYDAPVSGTVDSVSNSTSITSNGLSAVSVRVKLANPGAVSDSFTASARIGNYASYGQTPINLGGATIVYAGASGTIQGLNKLAGSTVKQGETLCTVESEGARDQIKNAKLNLENAQLAASMAADSLDDYNITSQITGTVIEKNFKAGDKVEGMNSGSLAVVYDMSYLKLEMAVDELDISKVEAGQSVTITADAVEGQTFTGVVDNVSINGTTAGGATSYPVTILIKDYGDLKPGMNVSATIEGDRVPNALCIPVDAVNRGNTVTVPGPGAMNADNTAVADVSKLETREVTLGKSDGDFIEVTGGLEEGDTVLIPNQSSNMMAEMMGM